MLPAPLFHNRWFRLSFTLAYEWTCNGAAFATLSRTCLAATLLNDAENFQWELGFSFRTCTKVAVGRFCVVII